MDNKKRFKSYVVPMLVISSLLFTGCGAEGNTSGEKAAVNQTALTPLELTKEPITIRMYLDGGTALSETEFNEYFVKPVQKVMPNVMLELLRSGKGATIDELVVADTIPDIIFTGNKALTKFFDMDIPAEMTQLAQKDKFDIKKFDSVLLDSINNKHKKAGLYVVPFSLNFAANFYNKDIFDKFAVPYPKDNMTMDEVLDLGRKVARNVNGIQYKAVDTNHLTIFGNSLRLPYIDEKTGKSALLSDGWKNLLQYYISFNVDIPGNNRSEQKFGVQVFIKEQTVAMYLANGGLLGNIDQSISDGGTLNWDVVSYPTFKEFPGKGWEVNSHVMMMSKSTKYPNEAFKVLSIVSEKENQLNMTKQSRLTALNDPEMRKSFAANLASTKGKNIEGIFKVWQVESAYRTEHDGAVTKQLNDAATKVMKGESDINTALQEANEAANKELETIKAADKK